MREKGKGGVATTESPHLDCGNRTLLKQASTTKGEKRKEKKKEKGKDDVSFACPPTISTLYSTSLQCLWGGGGGGKKKEEEKEKAAGRACSHFSRFVFRFRTCRRRIGGRGGGGEKKKGRRATRLPRYAYRNAAVLS